MENTFHNLKTDEMEEFIICTFQYVLVILDEIFYFLKFVFKLIFTIHLHIWLVYTSF